MQNNPPVNDEEEDFDDYFKENLETRTKNEIKLKNGSRHNSEKMNGNSFSSTNTIMSDSGLKSQSLVAMTDDDIENLKLDSKLKKYQLNLNKTTIEEKSENCEAQDQDEQQLKSPSPSMSTSRPQFRVPFFFK